ncbi:MAG: YggT family protein [Caulobacteraceae bacterium]
MDALLNFAQFVIEALLTLIIWIIIAYAILSWLIGFDIVNMRNRFVYRASHFLDAVANPLLRPFRRLLPSMGGLDFSPIILFIIIGGAQRYLIPPFFGWLHTMVNGGA